MTKNRKIMADHLGRAGGQLRAALRVALDTPGLLTDQDTSALRALCKTTTIAHANITVGRDGLLSDHEGVTALVMAGSALRGAADAIAPDGAEGEAWGWVYAGDRRVRDLARDWLRARAAALEDDPSNARGVSS